MVVQGNNILSLHNHSFNVEFARKYGMVEAIIIRRIQFLITMAQLQNFKQKLHDGRYWAHIWRSQYPKIYPYLQEKALDDAFKHLQQEGIIEIGYLNHQPRETDFWVTMARK